MDIGKEKEIRRGVEAPIPIVIPEREKVPAIPERERKQEPLPVLIPEHPKNPYK